MLVGKTSASLPIGPATAAEASLYSVVATNIAGAVTHSQILVRILAPARFSQPLPPLITLDEGAVLTLTAQIEGSGPFTFQWRLNGQDIANAVSSFYTIQTMTLADAGTYTVVVTDETGERDHATKPGLRSVWYSWTPPQNGHVTFRTLGSVFDTLLAVYTGDALATLAEVASNDDAANSGYFTSELTFSVTVNTRYGIAIAGLGDAGGNYVLSWEFLRAAPLVPRITSQPESRTVQAGALVELRVVAENADRIEWWFNGQRLTNANDPTLVLPALRVDQIGTYVLAGGGGGRTNFSHEAIVEIGSDPPCAPTTSSKNCLPGPTPVGQVGPAPPGALWPAAMPSPCRPCW